MAMFLFFTAMVSVIWPVLLIFYINAINGNELVSDTLMCIKYNLSIAHARDRQ